MDLEKEIEKYYYDNFAFLSSVHAPTLDILTSIAKHFVEWQKQQDRQTIELAEDHAMLAGMMKEREQMLKNAIEGIARPDDCEIWVNLKGCDCNYKDGDKIKLIIIKEEEK